MESYHKRLFIQRYKRLFLLSRPNSHVRICTKLVY